MWVIESANIFKGHYHILGGTLNSNENYEQKNLQLDIKKAKKYLDWYPTYSVKNGVKITTEWYKDVFKNKKDPFKVTINQILEYMNENNWC